MSFTPVYVGKKFTVYESAELNKSVVTISSKQSVSGVAIVCLNSKKQIALVRETRPCLKKGEIEVWNLPKGKVEQGHSLSFTAKKETAEELGISAPEENFKHLATINPDNSSFLTSIAFYCLHLNHANLSPQDPEILEACWFSKEAIAGLYKTGMLTDGYLASAIGLLELHGYF